MGPFIHKLTSLKTELLKGKRRKKGDKTDKISIFTHMNYNNMTTWNLK
jgi:hypothetical protein